MSSFPVEFLISELEPLRPEPNSRSLHRQVNAIVSRWLVNYPPEAQPARGVVKNGQAGVPGGAHE